VISLLQARYLHTGQHKHRTNAHIDIHFSVGFKHTVPGYERAKRDYASDSAATVSGTANLQNLQITIESAKLFHPVLSSPAVPWQQLLTVEILHLHAVRF
jgi:hypothetical protein